MSQDRRHDDENSAEFKPTAPSAPGKSTATARLSPRPLIFRVESADAARELGAAFGPRNANGVAAGADSYVQRAASSSGSALPDPVRTQFESSLGADLSSVRVHTGSESAEAASAVGAKAYTTGNDIHFGAGQYAPSDPFGLHLLAHEVAHTVQQSGGAASGTQYKLEVSTPGDHAEVEADRAADAMVAGRTASVTGASNLARQTIFRKPAAGAPGSEFGANGGTAGVMDGMAIKAGQKVTDGLPAITVPTDHAPKKATECEEGAAYIANLHVPGSAGSVGTDNPAVKQWQAESARYLVDNNYIALAQSAYDGAIAPTILAAKGFAQLTSLAHTSLGFIDDKAMADASVKASQIDGEAYKDLSELGAGLTASQKKALGDEVLNKESADKTGSVLAELDQKVSTAESNVTTTRRGLVSNSIDMQKAVLKKLEAKQKEKASAAAEDKTKIEDDIKAMVAAAENVGKVAKVVAIVGTGGLGAIEGGGLEIGMEGTKDGGEALKVAGELGLPTDGKAIAEASGGVLATAVESFAKAYYDKQLNTLENAIKTAGAGIAAAKAAGVDLSAFKAEFDMNTLAKTLVSQLQAWGFYLNQRKHYLATTAKGADQKASKGDKNKDSVSQLAALLNGAKEARSYLGAAKESIDAAREVFGVAMPKVCGHRDDGLPIVSTNADGYVTTKEGAWRDTNAPDAAALYKMQSCFASWDKEAKRQGDYINAIETGIHDAATK